MAHQRADHHPHRAQRHRNRRPARAGARGGRNRAAAVHRVWQSALGAQTDRTHRRDAVANFQLRHLTLRRLASAGVGRRAHAARARPAHQRRRAVSDARPLSPKQPMMTIMTTGEKPAISAAQPGNQSASAVPALTVKNLSVFFGKNEVLKKVSLDVTARAVTAIIGPSGCGKSTFLRSINRMHELVPEARMTGEIRLFGDDIYARNVEPVIVRRRVGMVFQKSNPFPTMSIVDNVTVGLRLNGMRNRAVLAERTEQSLRMAALWDEVKDRLHAPAISLSAGAQQRLCIARALAVHPEGLLMDEPAS